ncbi:hypothetical protein [Granulicella arctica]|uniref:Uncharacterized protein n=1 Tax=Granulicella arctica TaxID=940613 RepID=A0A7Y9PFV2_9BACT|nr:hypothetical protein [Granulicella arctica]NYF78945.1 hypothetical protein [Granulicella arctica]
MPHQDPPSTLRAPETPEIKERRRQARGLLLIAFAVLAASVLRAGVHRVFTTGWWHLW